jgi:hypothetical protein
MTERILNGAPSPGKVAHGLPLSLPKIESNEAIDAALLDVMSIEDFLMLLKNKTENNSRELWKETTMLASQLKASRELLTIGSTVYSSKVNRNILGRLIDASHVILNAERIHLLEIGPSGTHLTVTHSKDQRAIGRKIPVNVGIEGKYCFRWLLHIPGGDRVFVWLCR